MVRLRGMRPTASATTTRDAAAAAAATGAAAAAACGVCGAKEGRYGCPRCGIRYCSLACFRGHGACSEEFYAERVRAALAEEPGRGRTRCVGDLLASGGGGGGGGEDLSYPAPDEARLRALLDGTAAPTAAEEAAILRSVAAGDLDSADREPWAPWWVGIGRMDADVVAAAAACDAAAAGGAADAEEAAALAAAERGAERAARGGGGEGASTRAAVLGRAAVAPPLWALVYAPGAGDLVALCREKLDVTGAPAAPVLEALYSYAAVARAFDGDHGFVPADAANAWLAGCGALAGDARHVDARAALASGRERCVRAGIAEAAGDAALLADVGDLLRGGPRVVCAALLDGWRLVVRARGAPKRVRRKARYLALWCGAPVAGAALEAARGAVADARRDALEAAPPPEPAAPPPVEAALARLALSGPPPRDRVTDFDEPD